MEGGGWVLPVGGVVKSKTKKRGEIGDQKKKRGLQRPVRKKLC